MLNRRQMLTHVAGGIVVGNALMTKVQASPVASDPHRWVPQLSKSAQTLAEAEASGDRFSPETIHRVDFMPGVTLLVFTTEHDSAEDRLRMAARTLRQRGMTISKPGISADGKTWVLFVCGTSDEVARNLGMRAGRVRRHRAQAA